MRKAMAALVLAWALGAGAAWAEDLSHCKAGSAHMAQKAWAQARTELKQCLAKGALTADNRAVAHLNLSAVAYELADWAGVISEYDLAAKASAAAGKMFKPGAPPLLIRGLAYAQLKQWPKARAALDEAAATAPKEPRVRLARMDVLLALGQTEAALADGAALVALPDKNMQVRGRLRRAFIFEGMKRNEDALKEVDVAGAIDPANMEVVQARMNLFAGTKKWDMALAEGARLAASPLQKWALTGRMARAEMFRMQGKPNAAIGELDAAIKLAPNETAALFYRMTIYAETGQLDKALADSQPLTMSKDPKIRRTAHELRGMVFDRQKKYGDALSEADAVLALDPKSPIGFNNRCMALANLGRSAEATASCQKALDLAPNTPIYMNSMGYALEKAGRLQEAVSYYQKVADARPQDQGNLADLKRAKDALAAKGGAPR